MTNIALFTGRFQPPTIAHTHTLEKILARWQRVHIGVSDPSIPGTYDPQWEEFVQSSRSRFDGAKLVFTTGEVVSLWQAHVCHAGLADRVTCSGIPRPHLSIFSERFPSDSFDMVTMAPHPDDSDGDRVRHRLFPDLLRREIFHVVPDLVLHNSDIRRRVSEGAEWSEFLTPGVLARFMEIEGPRRCAL